MGVYVGPRQKGIEVTNWILFKNAVINNLSLFLIPFCSCEIDAAHLSSENTINYSFNTSTTQNIVNNFKYIIPSHCKELINKWKRLKRIYEKTGSMCPVSLQQNK
jgi:succinylarginine dihydrolase